MWVVKTQISEIQEISEKQKGNSLLHIKSEKKLLRNFYKPKIERFNRNKTNLLGYGAAAGIWKNEQ